MQSQKNKFNLLAGFTLIELSIVLVIIAIIIGGVLAGQEVVESAKLNSIVTDFSKYERLTNTFKLKYDSLPGDMTDAEDYWATADNGDGDGKITAITTVAESFFAWEMLGLAGLTPPYTGADSALVAGVTGTHYPKSRYCSICGFTFFSETLTTTMGAPFAYDTLVVNRMVFGAETTVVPALPTDSALTGPGARQIDTKMDDGVPGTGRVLGGGGHVSGSPGAGACVSGGLYIVTEMLNGCALVYTLDVDDQ